METSNIIIENRTKTSITGVTDVISFDETKIILDTVLGALVLIGEDFRINMLNVEVGDFTVDGKLNNFSYETVQKEKIGMFARLFK